MSFKIRLSKQQVNLAMEDYVRKQGYILTGGIYVEKIETMSDYWYEAWAWVDKEHDIEEIEEKP